MRARSEPQLPRGSKTPAAGLLDQPRRRPGSAPRDPGARRKPAKRSRSRFRPCDEDGYFGEQVAARYDESVAEMFDPAVVEPAVDFLAELAGDGRALELGIGTGRIALPLAARGVPVHGIELSQAMVARLRAKPGGEDDRRHDRRLLDATVDGTFSLVYLVFNTIRNLTTQAAQVACFRNVARAPRARRLLRDRGRRARPPAAAARARRSTSSTSSETHWGIDEYDVANQGLISHHFDARRRAVERPRCRSATSGRRSST